MKILIAMYITEKDKLQQQKKKIKFRNNDKLQQKQTNSRLIK